MPVLIPDGLEQAWLAPVHGAELRALEPLMQPWEPEGWRAVPLAPRAATRAIAVDRQQLSLELP
jgi:hypothetical protein